MPVIVQSAFKPLLFSSESLAITDEQKMWIREVLEISSSDIVFAQKAADAIIYILTVGSTDVPVVASLNPNTAELGTPSFTLHVIGSGFTPTSVIIWNGSSELTTFVNETELTTEVNMATAQVAIDIPVQVEFENGVRSGLVTFSLTEPPIQLTSKKVKAEDDFFKGME